MIIQQYKTDGLSNLSIDIRLINIDMRICEIINFGSVLPSSGQYQTPKRNPEFQKRKLKKKVKGDKDKDTRSPSKDRGQIIDINV